MSSKNRRNLDQPAAEGGRRRLYSLLKMCDVLNIKIDVKLISVGFKGWFRCQIRFQRGRKPWCTFRGRNYIRDRDIDVGHVQKFMFCDLCHEISCPDFSLSVLIRFRWGFFNREAYRSPTSAPRMGHFRHMGAELQYPKVRKKWFFGNNFR